MAVVCAGPKQGDEAPNDRTRVTCVGLAYMPSSVPPAIALHEGIGEDISDATPIISSHDWRRLQDVDLDDMVTQYGIKVSSTEVISGRRHLWRRKEPFRYGAKDLMTTMGGREDGRFYSGNKRIMIHYDSFQHKNAAMTALDGTMIGEYRLRTKLD